MPNTRKSPCLPWKKYEKNASEDRIIPLWQQQGQSTWKQLIRMLLLARGQRDDDKAIVDYQSTQLGSSTGDTCLAELLPLPSPDTATWNYGQWSDLDRVSSRQSDRASLMEEFARLKVRVRNR